MEPYPKIQSIFKRDEQTHKFIEGEYSLPEFEYLKDNCWVFTEKIDGTNVRVMWDGEQVRFGGRTDNAQMPTFLLAKLQDLFTPEKLASTFPETQVCLYGEGYGAKIQKGGGNYISNGVDFALFDVKIDEWWLKREDVEGIAQSLGIRVVPIVGKGTLGGAIQMIKVDGLISYVAQTSVLAEGIVVKPEVEIKDRRGHRIITKLKHKDFE